MSANHSTAERIESQTTTGIDENNQHDDKLNAIAELAGGIAHDFNNQLAIIQGFSELVRLKVADNPQLAGYLDAVLGACRTTANLNRQLLAFAGRGNYQRIRIDVNRVLRLALDDIAGDLDPRIAIEEDLAERNLDAIGDPDQMRESFRHVLLNAVDAMPDGGTLRISTAELTHEQALGLPENDYAAEPTFIRIQVTDTGVGMDTIVRQRVFEPFFSTKPRHPGAGLGMAATYGSIRRHEGSIDVQSKAGQGTTVTILLPLAQSVHHTTVDHLPHFTPAERSGSILVVDDEPGVRELATEALTTAGHQVHTCADGDDAVDYFRDHWQEIDVVILDMVMPRMSGTVTFKAMRRIDPDVKVLIASGYSDSEQVQKLLDQGAAGRLAKPFRLSKLSAKIAELL